MNRRSFAFYKSLACAVHIMLALAVIICLLPALSGTAQAAGEGTMMSNAVDAVFGQTYLKIWTNDTDHLNHYVKITVPQQGVVTITATKPYDDEGEYGKLYFTVYDANGEPVWGNESYQSVDDAKGEYRVNVGLAAGTYYLTLKPGFSVRSGLIETNYSVSFQADTYCEVEPNDEGYKATSAEMNQKCVGYFGSAGSNYEENDYWKVPVQAGHVYRIVWYNFAAMERTSTIVSFLMPDGEDHGVSYYLSKSINNEGLNYADVEVAASGTGYLYMYNFNGAQFEYGFVISDVTCTKTGHVYGEWATTVAATCSAPGSQVRSCGGCGATETRSLDKTAHAYGAWQTSMAASCTSAGTEIRYCSMCGGGESRNVDKLPHTYGGWTTTAEATCSAAGSKSRSCSSCGKQETQSIEKLKHTYDNDCDASCNGCGATRNVSHNFGKDWEMDDAKHWHVCSDCGVKADEQAHVPGMEATAVTPQNCKVCGYELAPATGREPQSTEPSETEAIPKPTQKEPAATEPVSDEPEGGGFPWWTVVVVVIVAAAVSVVVIIRKKRLN